MKLVAVKLSVFMGVVGCGWCNACRRVLIGMLSRALWNIPVTLVLAAQENTFLNVFHSTKVVLLSFRCLVMVG